MDTVTPDLNQYDHIILYFSGGKDSLACLLHLLDLGVDRSKIELWHHDVDGHGDASFMDWPITPAYCQAIADHFGIPLYFSWKEGGFLREMTRDHARTAPIHFQTPDQDEIAVGGTRGQENTRMMFPQVSADLSVRWCSAYLKIDVGAAAIRNQERFIGKRILTVSGERAQESAARAKYATFEPDRTDNREGEKRPRHVDRWRPVHAWDETQVWAIIERYQINPHPAYWLGWGRVSCMFCIFGSPDQWASARQVDPKRFQVIANYEATFGKTIQRCKSVEQLSQAGKPYPMDPEMLALSLSTQWTVPVILEQWTLPQGAYGDLSGPC